MWKSSETAHRAALPARMSRAREPGRRRICPCLAAVICIWMQHSFSYNVRAHADRTGGGSRCRGQTMTFHEYLSKAVQDDAQLAGERDRLALVARQARTARRKRERPAAPVRRLARLLLRRAPA